MQPQRSNGRLRVAAILKAAAEVIAEKGFEAATMAEIATRSSTQIGSLYRFFPNKELLANALIAHYFENIDTVFDALDERVQSLPLTALADAFHNLMMALHKHAPTIRRLLEADKVESGKRGEFRKSIHKRISKTLALRSPWLKAGEAQDIAVVVLHSMKTMVALSDAEDKPNRPGAVGELRLMLRIYLKDRLKKPTAE